MESAVLLLAFMSASGSFGLPQGLLSAVCYVESTHNVKAINYNDGNGHSLGVCQIKLATAKTLGFTGTAKELLKPEVNTYYAAQYLAHQIARYHGNVPRAVAAYNAGHYIPGANGRAKNFRYVDKVMRAWETHK